MTNAHRPLQVVLGSGQIGSRLTRRLLEAGYRVRVITQRPRSSARGTVGLEYVAGDLTDIDFAKRATAGASVVYDCTNPPYTEWPSLLLPLGNGALQGAIYAGAKLVALDCLYMYGAPDGPITETSPLGPCSKKGELRVALSNLRLEALRAGNAQVCIGRASDFIGPDLSYSHWNDRLFQRLCANRPGQWLGNPDTPHSYTFVDDIADALLILGLSDETGVWHLPTAPAETSRQVAKRLGTALGVSGEIERLPRWLAKGVGLFSPFLREVNEMSYQWDVPFVIDDTKFVTRFGRKATPLDVAVDVTAGWARRKYAASLSRPSLFADRAPLVSREGSSATSHRRDR